MCFLIFSFLTCTPLATSQCFSTMASFPSLPSRVLWPPWCSSWSRWVRKQRLINFKFWLLCILWPSLSPRGLPWQDGRAWPSAGWPLPLRLSGGHHPRDCGHRPDRPGHFLLDRVQPHHHLGLSHILFLSNLRLQLGLPRPSRGVPEHGHVGHHLLVHVASHHCGFAAPGGRLEILQGWCPPHAHWQGQAGPAECEDASQGRHWPPEAVLWSEVAPQREVGIRLRPQRGLRSPDHQRPHHDNRHHWHHGGPRQERGGTKVWTNCYFFFCYEHSCHNIFIHEQI